MIVHASDVDVVLSGIERGDQTLYESGMWDVGIAEADLLRLERNAGSAGVVVEKLLDEFVLVIRETRRQDVLDQFFASIAPRYAVVTQRDRNRDCVEALTFGLRQFAALSDGEQLVDFGCGDGVVVETSAGLRNRVVGIERLSEMSVIARRAGLHVVQTQRDLPDPIGGCISSYVLHLGPQLDELLDIWKRLAPGRGLAANFHKGVGFTRVRSALVAHGGVATVRDLRSDRFDHGKLVVFVRK